MVPAMLLVTAALAAPSTGTPPVAAPAAVTAPFVAAPWSPRAARWGWPLKPEPPVVASFRAPPTPWSAGHRGVDLAAAVGQPVLAAGGGRVTFAGSVAGRGVVVVTHPGGVRTSYEPVARRRAVGAAVVRGDRLGVVAPTRGHCAPRTCLHWGVRVGSRYVDPLDLVGRGPPVLLPWR